MKDAARALAVLVAVTSLCVLVRAAGYPTQKGSRCPAVVFYNATVYTSDPSLPLADAFAVCKNVFVDVGSSATLFRKYPTGKRVNLNNTVVLPGLIDGHGHLMSLGLNKLRADLYLTNSVPEIIKKLQDFVASSGLSQNAWLVGEGWDQTRWPVKDFPTHQPLDDAFPNRPVLLERVDGHALWANSVAMSLAKIPAVDPPGGRIIRDNSTGQPTGVFVDAAMDIIYDLIPPYPKEDQKKALQLAMQECNKVGLTGVHDAGIGEDYLQLYKEAIDEGKFSLRVYAMVRGTTEGTYNNTVEKFCNYPKILNYGGKLHLRAAKLFVDGALGSRGAALLEDYSDDPGNSGLLQISQEELNAVVYRWIECGWQVCSHAIGDKGNQNVLNAYQNAMARLGTTKDSDLRLRVEHAQIVAPQDFARFAGSNIIASMQPTHATSDMRFAEARLGPKRILGAYAWQTFLHLNVTLSFGSDFPIEKPDPLPGIYSAVTRQDQQGMPEGGWYPEQRLSRLQALHAFTMAPAHASFMEGLVGSITPTKYADFVVLSSNIMDETLDPKSILTTQVLQTWVSGKCVYDAKNPSVHA